MHKVGKSYKRISRTKKEQKVNKMCTNGRNPGLLLLCWGTHPTNITEGENSYQCNSFKTLDKNSANGKTTKQKLLFSGKQNKTKQNIENIRCVLKTSLENADEPKCDLFGENVCTTFEGKGQCEQCEAWWRDHHGWGLNVLWSVRKNSPKHTKRTPPNG